MLFLGNKTFPKGDEFMMVTTQNGGYTNATTGRSDTFYDFKIEADKLDEGLDGLSSFFVALCSMNLQLTERLMLSTPSSK